MSKPSTSRASPAPGGRATTGGPGRDAPRAATPGPANQNQMMTGSARSILRGELDRIGLSTLLTILEMERRSGLLVLSRQRQLGRLHVRDGQIIRARIEGQRRQQGEEAVYQMLTWPEGQFEMWQTEVEGRDEIRHRTTYLLMEGMRRVDERQGFDRSDDGAGVPADPDGDALLVF